MTSYANATNEELIEILKDYMEAKYWKLNNWTDILANATINEEYHEVWFKLATFDLGLDLYTLEFKDVTNIHGFDASGN